MRTDDKSPLVHRVFARRPPPSTHLVAIATGRIRIPGTGYLRELLVEPGLENGELFIRIEYSYEVPPRGRA